MNNLKIKGKFVVTKLTRAEAYHTRMCHAVHLSNRQIKDITMNAIKYHELEECERCKEIWKREEDKILKFDVKFQDQLINGEKTKTVRGNTKLVEGDIVKCMCNNVVIAIAKIKRIDKKPLALISKEDLKGHNTNNKWELKENLENYYNLDYDSNLAIIEFEVR